MTRLSTALLCVVGALLLGCPPFYRDDELRALRASDSRRDAALLGDAQQQLSAGRSARAARLLSEAMERNPARDAESYLSWARAQQQSGQHAAARATARMALARSEGRPAEQEEARRFLLASYAKDQLIGRALDWLVPQRLSAAAMRPELAEPLAALIAAEQLAATQPARALGRYAQWLSSYGEPDHPLLRSARAQILNAVASRTEGFAAEGLRLLRRGEVSPAIRYYALAYRYQTDAQFAVSEADFLRACAALKDPESTSPLASSEARRGDIELSRDHLGEALHSYRRAVAAAPCWPAAHRNLALLLAQTELRDEAVRQMDWFLKLHAGPAPEEQALRDDWAAPPAERLRQAQAVAAKNEGMRRSTAKQRQAGMVLFALAGISGGLAGLFGYLGADVNRQIQSGNLATLADLEAVHTSGQRYNGAVIGCAVGAGVLGAVSLPLLFLGLRQPKSQPSLTTLAPGPGQRIAP